MKMPLSQRFFRGLVMVVVAALFASGCAGQGETLLNPSVIDLSSLSASDLGGSLQQDHFSSWVEDDFFFTIEDNFSISNNCRTNADNGAEEPALDCEGVANDDLDNFDYVIVFQCTHGSSTQEMIVCRNSQSAARFGSTCGGGTIDFEGPDNDGGTDGSEELDNFTFGTAIRFQGIETGDACTAAWLEVTDSELFVIDQVDFEAAGSAEVPCDLAGTCS